MRISRALIVPITLLSVSISFAQDFEVTLLGTGTPRPSLVRFGPSTLVRSGDTTILVDVGRGAFLRLSQLNVPYSDIDAIYLTHLHSDHVVGLPDLWLTGWIFSDRDSSLTIYGPKGTADLVRNLRAAFAFDLHTRSTHESQKLSEAELRVVEVEDGSEFKVEDFRVTAVAVDHHKVVPAFGYKIKYGNRSVAISGDTKYSENFVESAMNADLLIHEVMAMSPQAPPGAQRILQWHSSPSDVARIFSTTKPKLAVLSHLILADVSESQLFDEVKIGYAGRFVVGTDLMTFKIGDDVSIINK
jgi:ribonuclease Z